MRVCLDSVQTACGQVKSGVVWEADLLIDQVLVLVSLRCNRAAGELKMRSCARDVSDIFSLCPHRTLRLTCTRSFVNRLALPCMRDLQVTYIYGSVAILHVA